MMLSEGASYSRIMRECSAEWGICTRQIDVYIAKARKRLVAMFKVQREEFVAEQLTALADLADKATRDRQYSAAVGARSAYLRATGCDTPNR
jgi:hypothetical protein